MKTDHDILAKIDRDSGMTVPDGYFADFASRMEAAIPANRPKIAEAPRSFWQQVRPYAYLAAMFARNMVHAPDVRHDGIRHIGQQLHRQQSVLASD